MTSDQIEGLVQHLVHVPPVIGDAGQCQHRLLPQILVLDFSHRQIEFLPQSIFQTQKNLPLVFQRLTVGDEKLDRAEPDGDAHKTTGS